MRLIWSTRAVRELVRLQTFLAETSPQAAARVARTVVAAVDRLQQQPRIGVRLEGFGDHEVRRIIVGNYEVRYAIADAALRILALWHTRERR